MENRVPKTNNGDHKRAPLSPASIMRRSDYAFRLQIVRRFMTASTLHHFITEYDKYRQSGKMIVPPTKRQLKLFRLYDEGKMTLPDLAQALGFDKTYKANSLIGRLYAYQKEETRNGSGAAK